ncbi:MAG: acyltransferase, partial [Planctomycetes bacterium]|nr:acyltransferase [Planctomycetota bacterium]
VDLFFVLSGFLITGILLDAKGRPHYFRDFYLRRVLRIFPAYYALLLLFFVLLPLLHNGAIDRYLADSAPDQAWHWTYLSNFRIAWRGTWYQHHFPNVFWSLAIEEQFYMVWPLVVALCGRSTLRNACLALVAISLGFRLALLLGTDANWVTRFVLTPGRMDGLAIGALLATSVRSGADPAATRRAGWIALLGAATPLLALELQRPDNWRDLPLQSARFTLVAVVCGAALWLALGSSARSPWRLVFESRSLRTLGKYSYALYLWHGPAVALVRAFFHPNDHGTVWGSRLPLQIAHFAAALALSLLAAWLSFQLIERHFLALKTRFSHRPANRDSVRPTDLPS